MMKNSKIYFGLAACAALILGLPSCSQDEIPVEDNQPIVTEDTETSYVTVRLTSPKGGFNGGRAMGDNSNNFDNGTGSESYISSVLLVFYDDAGRAITSKTVTTHDLTNKGEGDVPSASDPSVETKYEYTATLNLIKGTNLPTQVVAYVNPQRVSDQLTSLSDVETKTRTNYGIPLTPAVTVDGTAINFCHTMNNSVYYENGVKKYATPLVWDVTDKNKATATVYVERMAAKVSVGKAESFVISAAKLPGNDNQTFTFKPEKWTLTATEKASYLIKNLPPTKPGTDFEFVVPTGTQLYRSYWAHSVTYSDAAYPMTGCDVDESTTEGSYPLSYRSYNEVATGNEGVEFGANTPKYCLEHTIPMSVWLGAKDNGYNNYATATAVLLVGEYDIAETTSTGNNFDNGFYVYLNQAYDETHLIGVMSSHQNLIVKEVNDGDGTKYEPVDASYFTVAHVHNFSNMTAVPSNRVALQLAQPKNGEKLYWAKNADGTNRTEIVFGTGDNANINEVQNAVAQYANALATHYNQKKAFFYIPIEHIGLKNDGSMQEGAYGVVRNHFYKVTINKIANMGYGIHDLNDPLIPIELESESKSLVVTFNVNAWHLMSQGVDL